MIIKFYVKILKKIFDWSSMPQNEWFLTITMLMLVYQAGYNKVPSLDAALLFSKICWLIVWEKSDDSAFCRAISPSLPKKKFN